MWIPESDGAEVRVRIDLIIRMIGDVAIEEQQVAWLWCLLARLR
jgi:hypothetical protein